MSRVQCKPCLAFDALAALVFNKCCRDDISSVGKWAADTFQSIPIDPSDSFFRVLTAHYTLDEIEAFDVETLADVYPQYIREDAYVKQYRDALLEGLKILKKAGFTELWHQEMLPVLARQADEALFGLSDATLNGVLSDVARVHNRALDGDIRIYMTYFTYPVSFQITANSFITNHGIATPIQSKPFLRLFAHELCHGFSGEAARKAYRSLCNRDEYLRKANWFLNEFCAHPGDEEEFVQAIEHAIAVKNGLETHEEVIRHFRGYYRYGVPVAVLLFEELQRLCELPEDMNACILAQYAPHGILGGDIASKVDSVITGYSDSLYRQWAEEERTDPGRFASYVPL